MKTIVFCFIFSFVLAFGQKTDAVADTNTASAVSYRQPAPVNNVLPANNSTEIVAGYAFFVDAGNMRVVAECENSAVAYTAHLWAVDANGLSDRGSWTGSLDKYTSSPLVFDGTGLLEIKVSSGSCLTAGKSFRQVILLGDDMSGLDLSSTFVDARRTLTPVLGQWIVPSTVEQQHLDGTGVVLLNYAGAPSGKRYTISFFQKRAGGRIFSSPGLTAERGKYDGCWFWTSVDIPAMSTRTAQHEGLSPLAPMTIILKDVVTGFSASKSSVLGQERPVSLPPCGKAE